MKLAFVGMTHLGLVSAMGATLKGHEVVCFDPNKSLIQRLNQGEIPFAEPNVQETLLANRHSIHFTSDLADLTSQALVYIAPDIPTNDAGESDLSAIEELLALVFPHLNPEAIVVIHSQVSPGFCRKVEWKHLYYHVETLIFGRALERASNPERMIIGMRDSHHPLPKTFETYLQSYQCPILTMKYESAELTKIAINLFLISSVSTTNTIAGLCEKIGARWQEIATALKLDKRIGPHAYLTPGLGISGGNLERDMATFCRLADQSGSDCTLIRKWQALSKEAATWALKQLHKKNALQSKKTRITILGLAYKQDTSSIKNSPAITLIKHLKDFQITAYDPVVKTCTEGNVKLASSVHQALSHADVIAIMTPWKEFATLDLNQMETSLIIDPYGMLSLSQKQANYVTLGESHVCC